MINPWKLIGYVVVGLLIIAGVFAWNRRQDAQYAAEIARWKVELHARDSVLAEVVKQRDEATAANARSVPVYLAGRTRILHDTVHTPAENLQACFDLADARISACELARKADSAVIVAQQGKIQTLEAKPEKRDPRFVLYGAAGYSVTIAEKETRTAPAFRAGIDTKLLGPVRLTTDAQLTMPGRGRSNPMWQGNIVARINF